MFEGPNKDILPAFESAGDRCPERFNPADFIISLVNSDFDPNVDLEKYEKKFVEWREANPDTDDPTGERIAERSGTG